MKPKTLFLVVVCFYGVLFFVFSSLDKRWDLDGWENSSFPVFSADSHEYTVLANNLVQNRIFSADETPPFYPNSCRTPGYPAWIAFIQTLFGSIKAVSITQILMTATISLLIFAMGKIIFSPGVGFMAALLYILDPVVMFHSLTIATEIPFTFLLMISLYLLFFAEKKRSFLAGFFLGLATLVKPIAMFLPFILIPFFILFQFRVQAMKKIGMGLLVLIVGFGCILSPWILRNKRVTGIAALVGVTGFNIMHANLPKLLAIQHGSSILDEIERLHVQYDIGANACSLQTDAKYKKIFFGYLKKYPVEYFMMHMKGALLVPLTSGLKLFVYQIDPLQKALIRFNLLKDKNMPIASSYFFAGKATSLIRYYFNQEKIGLVFLLEHIFWLTICLLGLVALLPLRKMQDRQRFFSILLLAVLVAYFCMMISPMPAARYRLLLEPFLLLLAMGGLKRFFPLFSKSM